MERNVKWEYLKEIADENYLTLPYLNELGAKGWELVSVDDGTAYFKRPLLAKRPETFLSINIPSGRGWE